LNTSGSFEIIKTSDLGSTRNTSSCSGIKSTVTSSTEVLVSIRANTSSGGVGSSTINLRKASFADTVFLEVSAVTNITVKVLTGAILGLIFNGAVRVRHASNTRRRFGYAGQPLTTTTSARNTQDSAVLVNFVIFIDGAVYHNKFVGYRVIWLHGDSISSSYGTSRRKISGKQDSQNNIKVLRSSSFLHVNERRQT
jgi:hypothetical protein